MFFQCCSCLKSLFISGLRMTELCTKGVFFICQIGQAGIALKQWDEGESCTPSVSGSGKSKVAKSWGGKCLQCRVKLDRGWGWYVAQKGAEIPCFFCPLLPSSHAVLHSAQKTLAVRHSWAVISDAVNERWFTSLGDKSTFWPSVTSGSGFLLIHIHAKQN